MNIGKHALSLATALALGATIVGLSTGSAEAAPRHPKDNGVRCAIRGSLVGPTTDDIEFYLPGEEIPVTDPATGRTSILKCMPDGTWKRVLFAPKPSDGGSVAPRGVNSQ